MWSTVVQDLYSKCMLGRSKHKSSRDVAGTAQKRIRKWQAYLIYLRRHCQVFEAQDPNVEWCMKAAAAVQNAIRCQPVSRRRIKELLLRHLCIDFSRGHSWIELNTARNKSLCLGVRPEDTAACPVTVAVRLQLRHLPAPLCSAAGNSSRLLSQGQPLYAGCSAVLHFSRHCTVRFKTVLPLLCLFFMHQLCKNYYKPTTGQIIQLTVLSGYLG